MFWSFAAAGFVGSGIASIVYACDLKGRIKRRFPKRRRFILLGSVLILIGLVLIPAGRGI